MYCNIIRYVLAPVLSLSYTLSDVLSVMHDMWMVQLLTGGEHDGTEL